MKCLQKEINIKSMGRGFHLVTDEIMDQLDEIRDIKTGIAHIFIKHTSASLSLNENADPTVRTDMEKHLTKWSLKMPRIMTIMPKVQMICLHILNQ